MSLPLGQALHATVHCDRRKWLLIPTAWGGRFSDPREWADTVAARCWEAWMDRNPGAKPPGVHAVERTALLLKTYADRYGSFYAPQPDEALTYLYLPDPAGNTFLMHVSVDDTSGLTVAKAMAEPDMASASGVGEFTTDARGSGRKFTLHGALDVQPGDPPGPPGEWLSVCYIFDVPGRQAMVTVRATDSEPAHIDAASDVLDEFVRGITVSTDGTSGEAWDPHPGRAVSPATSFVTTGGSQPDGAGESPAAAPPLPQNWAARAGRVAVAVGIGLFVLIAVWRFPSGHHDDSSNTADSHSPLPPQRHATLGYLTAASWKPQVDIQDTDYPGADVQYALKAAGVASSTFGPGWRIQLDSAPADPSIHLSDLLTELTLVGIGTTPCSKAIDVASQPPTDAHGPTALAGLPSGWRGVRSSYLLEPTITLAGCRAGTLVYGRIDALGSGLTNDEVDAAADRLAAAIAHRGITKFRADTAPSFSGATAAPDQRS